MAFAAEIVWLGAILWACANAAGYLNLQIQIDQSNPPFWFLLLLAVCMVHLSLTIATVLLWVIEGIFGRSLTQIIAGMWISIKDSLNQDLGVLINNRLVLGNRPLRHQLLSH